MKAGSLAMVCLFLLCSAVFGEDEEIGRWLERRPDHQERLEAYERLREMRRARGLQHLPPATQFEFARQWQLRTHDIGATGPKGCAWSSAGPTNLNGRVTAIAIDPTNNQRVYATTFGGIFRSETAGRRWQRVSDDWLATVFSAIAVNPTDTSEIFAGGGDKDLNPGYTGDGLWRSNNFGAPGSWDKVTNAAGNTPFNDKVIYRIRVDPTSPNNVYVAASNGIWLGVRNGAFFDFTAPMGGCNAVVDDVAVDFFTKSPTVYMAVREGPNAPSIPAFPRGIYKWDAANNQWLKKDSGIATVDTEVILLGLAASNPKVLYAKVTKTNGTHQGFYRTTTAAEGKPAWTKTTDSDKLDDCGGLCWFSNTVEVDPKNELRVIASGGWPYFSPDGGETFEPILDGGKDTDVLAEVHGDMHTAAFDPVNPNIVYVGNDGGIDKSTDMSDSKWHWIDSSHGMVATMFYNLTSNRIFPTTLAGGSQDNGIDITFGNRTWYRPVWCDGLDVGTDAKNPITLYASCNGGLTEYTNPIPGTDHGGETVSFVSPLPKGPLATDIELSGRAIAAYKAIGPCAPDGIVTTVDGKTWTLATTSFPNGAVVAALAVAPKTNFLTFLVAVKRSSGCPTFTPSVSRTDDGGLTWKPTTGLPGIAATSVAFDPTNPKRAYAMYEGSGIYMTTDGFAFSNITGTGATALPSGATRVVVDPWNKDVLYAATPVGVFRGVIPISTPFNPPTAEWTPFDEGLPDALDVNDLWVDPASGILTIGTFGHGAYRRDITPGASCKPQMLVVRDNVYDDGREPDATTGWPDAEHPIPDSSKPGFYKPDDTIGGKVWWYTSRDIRIDVPWAAPHQNQIENADHVEFEICPITASPCEPGGMIDAPPKAGKPARVYVQVTNRGLEPVTKTRVIALWTKLGTGFPDLPESFWKTTFPQNGECGTLDESTGWHLVDEPVPCRMIDSVNPEMPELARFDWTPPLTADGGATILTIVEAADDPIEKSIREENKLDPSEIVPGSRHIALRNIKIVPLNDGVREPFLWPIDFPHVPVEPLGDPEIVVSKPDLREAVRIVLPAGVTAHAGLGSARPTRITEPDLVRQLETMRLDPSNAWELSGDEASLFLSSRETVSAGVIATPAEGNASSRFSLTQRVRETVVGGVMVLFRPQGGVALTGRSALGLPCPVQAIVPFEEVPTKWVKFIVKTYEHFGFPPPPSTSCSSPSREDRL
jgi:hypothetical protein